MTYDECSFCKASKGKISVLYAGQDGCICDKCVSVFGDYFASRKIYDFWGSTTKNSFSSESCSFCGESGKELIGSFQRWMCSDCVGICCNEEEFLENFEPIEVAEVDITTGQDTLQAGRTLQLKYGCGFVDLENNRPSSDALDLIPLATAKRLKCLIMAIDGNGAIVVMVNPDDIDAYHEIKSLLRKQDLRMILRVCRPSSFKALMDQLLSEHGMPQGDL